MRSTSIFFAVAALLAGAAVQAQGPEAAAMDLMPIADTNQDGKVTLEEYKAFTAQGWGFVSQGADKVKVADLDPQAQLAFFGITPDAQGYVTQKAYLDAAPARFALFDADKNGSLDSSEINGRPPQ